MDDAILSHVEHKTCIKCGEAKPRTDEFYPKDNGRLRNTCKTCRAADKRKAMADREEKFPEKREKRLADARLYTAENLEKIKEYKRDYASKHIDVKKEYSRSYYLRNAETAKERAKLWKQNNPEKRLENNRRWALENPEKSADCYRKNKARRMSDPITAFIENTRCLIGISVRKRGYTKRSKTQEILGCDWDAFKSHIEKQFLPGMCWGNRAEWHIDHITPVATAKTEQEVLALNHFSNLRPMWAKDNLSKGAKITHLI